MLNYFLRLRRKKGFTLVELIIVVAILAVLMASIAALSGPIRKMVSRTSASTDAISANITMANYIENRLGFAANIEILCAYDATDASATAINEAFNNMKSYLLAVTPEGDKPDSRDKAGVLIFHYVEDTAYPEESHYEIYDVSLIASDMTGKTTITASDVHTNYYNAAISASGGTNEIKESAAVFADCIYQYSKNLFIAPTEMTANRIRGNYFLTFEVVPYNFDPDMLEYDASGKVDTTVNQYISSSTIPSYYINKANREAAIAAGTDPLTLASPLDESCGLSVIDQHRLGTKETVTFELQNITAPTRAEKTANINNRFKVHTPAPGAVATGGSDILIFYYVPHY